MSYLSNDDLPENIKSALPDNAKDIFRKAYNSALSGLEPNGRDGGINCHKVAQKIAWLAVRSQYQKDDSGSWQYRSSLQELS